MFSNFCGAKFLMLHLGLKQMVNLLSGYPDICGYPTDSDIIKLVLLAIYFMFISTSSAKYSSLSILISIQTLLVSIKIISKLLEIISYYPKQFKTCMRMVNLKWISRYFGYLFQL